MLSWQRTKTALGYGCTFALIVCTFIAVQSQSYEEEPSAEGRLSQYYGPDAVALLYPGEDGRPYPSEYGDWPPLYPGDEKWDGISRAIRRYPTDIQSMATDGNIIYAGGGFLPVYPYEPTIPLARWDNNQWKRVVDGTNGLMQGKVYAVATQGSNLYAGGIISVAGSTAVKNVARWDGQAWNAMAGGVYMSAGDGDVAAIAIDGSNVYVGGWFDRAGGQVANNIARWDGQTWYALGSGVNEDVKAIAVNNGVVYAGGAFSSAGGVAANHIARWNGANWSAMGSGVDGMVNTIAIQGSDIYIGGDFYQSGGQAIGSVARWDGSQWRMVGEGLYGSIQTIKAAPEGIYAAGRFQKVFGQYTAFSIALWNGSHWTNLGSGIKYDPIIGVGYPFGFVNDVLPLGNRLYTGGIFTYAGNNWSDGFAWWNKDAAVVLPESGSSPVAPGSTIYLYGNYFLPYETLTLSVNGEVLAHNLSADVDGKVYVRLLTKPENTTGVYPFTLTSPTHTVSGSFTLDKSANLFTSSYTGWNFTYPPYTVHLPVIKR